MVSLGYQRGSACWNCSLNYIIFVNLHQGLSSYHKVPAVTFLRINSVDNGINKAEVNNKYASHVSSYQQDDKVMGFCVLVMCPFPLKEKGLWDKFPIQTFAFLPHQACIIAWKSFLACILCDYVFPNVGMNLKCQCRAGLRMNNHIVPERTSLSDLQFPR